MKTKDIIISKKQPSHMLEGWSQKYKKSINCSHPKGFSQRAHCAGKRKHNESVEMEMTCEDCGMCETHGSGGHLEEACWKGYHKEGMKTMFGKRYPNCIKNKNESLETYVRKGECPGCGGHMVAEGQLNEKQDACYHKVKSRYKVWPSAYASGALVQCRKKGAANWGNSNESITQEEYDQLDENLKKWFSDKWVRFGPDGKIRGDCARGDDSEGKPKCLPQSQAHSLGKKGRASAASRKRRQDPNPERSGKAINVATKKNEDQEMKFRDVVNTNEAANAAQQAAIAIAKKKKQGVAEGYGTHPSQRVDPRTGKKYVPPKSPLGKGVAESTVTKQMIHRLADKKNIAWDNEPKFLAMTKRLTGKEHLDDLNSNQLQKVYDHLNKQGVAEDVNGEYDDEAGMAQGNLYTIAKAAQGLLDTIDDHDNLPEWAQEKIAKVEGMLVTVWNYLQSQKAQGIDPKIDEMYEAMDQLAEEMAAKKGISADLVWETFEALPDNMLYETAAWHRKAGKNKNGGLNAKGVASYRREHPGSKLQTAVTTKPSKLKPGSKAAKRRKSFCARMSGVKGPMKKPNGKPTRKALALRKWNC